MEERKVLVFSIALEGYAQLFKRCIESHQKYCKRFGFDYFLVDTAPGKLRPVEAAWLKIFLLRSALNGDYHWIAFLDADCEVRSHAPSFLKEFQKYKTRSIFMAHGFSKRINSGVIFLRNNKEAKDYLDKVIANRNKEIPDEDKALYENGHMIHYGNNNPHIQIVDFLKWNNNRFFDGDSYVQHYSGGKLRNLYLTEYSPGIDKPQKAKYFKKLKSFFKANPKPEKTDIQSLVSFYQESYPKVFK